MQKVSAAAVQLHIVVRCKGRVFDVVCPMEALNRYCGVEREIEKQHRELSGQNYVYRLASLLINFNSDTWLNPRRSAWMV